jgi:hypothetical protein
MLPNPTNDESFPGPDVTTSLMYWLIALMFVYGAGEIGGL